MCSSRAEVHPVAGWFSLPSGFRSVPLGPLRDEDALHLLEDLGVASGEATRLNRIARGHPLALTLAVAGVAERPELELEEAASSRVIDELARLYLWEVKGPARASLAGSRFGCQAGHRNAAFATSSFGFRSEVVQQCDRA